QVRIADADLDLVRFQREFARDRLGDDAAGAGADVLRCGARDEAAVANRKRDFGSELPEIEPIARSDADAAAIAAFLDPGEGTPAPGLEGCRPIVQALAVGIGVPALA